MMPSHRPLRLPSTWGLAAACSLLLVALVAGCDAGFHGTEADNQVPDTELSIRDVSLVDNFEGRPGLTSTITVSWSGTDPDGYVAAFDVRFFSSDSLSFYDANPETGWTRTASRDTTALLPIPGGEASANVAFEVRAVDNVGAVDPEPARTVFPIRNSPPTATLSSLELPPDTTWPVLSFVLGADDPDGFVDVTGLDVSFNDSTSFVRLPAETEFVTFVATDPGAETTDAEIFLGRALIPTGLTVPDLRLNSDNVLFVRSADRTDTTSTVLRYPDPDGDRPFFVRRVQSEVLLVNDYRSSRDETVLPFHRETLADYLGGAAFDEWDLSSPSQVSGTASPAYADNLPTSTDPTLGRTLRLWTYIYWVSKQATNTVRGNNLPLAATVFDGFFADGGRLFVNVPIDVPNVASAAGDNAAIALLPTSGFVDPGDSNLRLRADTPIVPVANVPGTDRPLPPLQTARLLTGASPFEVGGGVIPLYEADAFYLSPTNEDWTGSQVVASMDESRRVALMGLPLVRETTGGLDFVGADGEEDAVTEAIQLILEGLTFPR
jgi:hypothetical protein